MNAANKSRTERLAEVKEGDLLLCDDHLLTVKRRTPKRVICDYREYDLRGRPIGGHGAWASIPAPEDIERIQKRKAEQIASRERLAARARELNAQRGYKEAGYLLNLGGYGTQELLDKYGPDRIIAAWRALEAK